MNQCFGIKIILQDKDNPVIEDTTIGLYNVASDNSELKWIQNDISGLTLWKSGMIIEKGIEPFSIEIDLTTGGNISYPGKGSVSIKNNLQFHQTILDKNIKIAGLKLEIWHFSGSTGKRYRTYICEEPTFDSKKFTIPFKGGQENRISNILNRVTTLQFPFASNNTVNEVIPATFGKLYPLMDTTRNISSSIYLPAIRSTIAKGIRVSDQEISTTYNNSVFEKNGLYPEINQFPVVYDAVIGEKIGTLEINFECRGEADTSILIFPVDTYVYIVSGRGNGQFRKCFFIQQTNDNTFTALITSYLETDLDDQRGTDQSWIKFVVLRRDYYFDHFACKSFLDVNGNEITQNPSIFTIEDETIQQAMDYGYECKDVSTDNNHVEIDPTLFTNDINTLDSFTIKPITDIYALMTIDLSSWNQSGESWGEDYLRVPLDPLHGGGLYYKDSYGYPASISGIPMDFFKIYDKQNLTYFDYPLDIVWGVNEPRELMRCIAFTLPSQPDIPWEDLYLCIKLSIDTDDQEVIPNWSSHFKIMLRKWKYGVVAVDGLNVQTANSFIASDFPDFYYLDATLLTNYDFYHEMETKTWQDSFTGYKIFKITGIDRNNYNQFVEGLIINCMEKGLNGDSDLTNNIFQLFELAFLFKKSNQDISKDILTPFKGRIFNSTFSARKTSTDLIEHPVDLLEHICRLQDYRDTCSMPISGWGYQYADTPLIETGLEFGSFDNTELIAARDYYLAGQIIDYDQGYTDKLKQCICSEFALANWQSADGKERVIFLPESKLSSVYTITLDDITDRSKIKVQKISSNKIYAEPFVNYNFNPATEKYDNAIYIKNTSASVYNQSYVIGIESPLEKEILWNSCHSLALQCHSLNKPPSNMTDLIFANGDGAYTIAYNHLKSWINWQFCEEINFETHFNIAGSWQECTPINVLFSHQTNNVSRGALVEESIVNPNHPYDVMIRAIMYA
jgi:hypothetical protein